MEKTATAATIITVIIFLVLLSYKFSLAITPLTIEQKQVMQFLQEKAELSSDYTSLETAHLQDVKEVMGWADALFLISVLLLFLFSWHFKINYNQLKLGKIMQTAGLISLFTAGLILLLMLLSFQFTFTLFHQLFFPQGNWQFAADSLLIQTFPGSFFTAIGLKIFFIAMDNMITGKILKNYLLKLVQKDFQKK